MLASSLSLSLSEAILKVHVVFSQSSYRTSRAGASRKFPADGESFIMSAATWHVLGPVSVIYTVILCQVPLKGLVLYGT